VHVKTLQKVLIADEYVFAVLCPYLTKVYRNPGIAHTDVKPSLEWNLIETIAV
jgi:hypothetical protein